MNKIKNTRASKCRKKNIEPWEKLTVSYKKEGNYPSPYKFPGTISIHYFLLNYVRTESMVFSVCICLQRLMPLSLRTTFQKGFEVSSNSVPDRIGLKNKFSS